MHPFLFEEIVLRQFQEPSTTAPYQAAGNMDEPESDGIRLLVEAFFGMEPQHPNQQVVGKNATLKDG